MKELIKRISELLFGYRYKAVIVNATCSLRFEISCFIYADNEAGNRRLDDYLCKLHSNMTYSPVEIITFRSRNEYAEYLNEKSSDAGRENIRKEIIRKLTDMQINR
jgi:hypothetical protein